jgi:hypothetical protein
MDDDAKIVIQPRTGRKTGKRFVAYYKSDWGWSYSYLDQPVRNEPITPLQERRRKIMLDDEE